MPVASGKMIRPIGKRHRLIKIRIFHVTIVPAVYLIGWHAFAKACHLFVQARFWYIQARLEYGLKVRLADRAEAIPVAFTR